MQGNKLQCNAINLIFRQAELLRQHSSRADLVVVTLPLPKYHSPSPAQVFHLTFYHTIILSMEGYCCHPSPA